MPLVGRGLGRGIGSLVPDMDRDIAVERLARRVEMLERELALHRMRTESMTAEEMYIAARSFIAANPGVWELIKRHAREAAKEGRRFSMKREFEDMRGEVEAEGSAGWRFRNSITPPCTRLLLLEVPEAAEVTALGRSKVDKYFDGTCEPPAWPPESEE